MNSIQSNNNTSLFGNSGGGGGGLFGGGGNNTGNSGGSGTPMFGGKNTPNKGGAFGGGSSSTGNSMFGGGGGMGGGMGQSSNGTVGVRYAPQKNKENIPVVSITSQSECKTKCLDELRLEDYRLMKSGNIPQDIQQKIQKNMQGGGSSSMGSLSGNLMGGNNNNNAGGGGLFGGNTGGNNAGGGALPNLALSRGNVIPGSQGTGGGGLGGSSGGGLFGGNNNAGGSSGGGLFGGNNNNNAAGGGGGLFGGNKTGTGNTGGGGLFGGNNTGNNASGGGGGLFGGNNNNNAAGGGGGLFGGNKTGTGNTGGGLFGGGGGNTNTGGGGGLFGGNNTGNTSGGGGGLFGGNNAGGGGGGLFGGNKTGTGNTGGGGLFGGNTNTSGGGGGLFGGSNTSGGGGGLFGGQGQGQQGGGLFGGQGQGQQGGGLFGQQQGGNNALFPNQQQQQGGNMMYNADVLRALFENMDPSWRAKFLESWQGKTEQTQTKDGAAEKKDSSAAPSGNTTASGNYVPYKPQEPKIDSKEPGYGRKKTLNELAASLANRSYYEQRSLLNESNILNYSTYDVRGLKKMDDGQKSALGEGFGLTRRLGTHSVVRKPNYSEMNDHNSSYLDDNIEIQLRPKSLYSSKRILEDLNSSRASLNESMLRKERKKNIYDNSTTIEVEAIIQGRRLENPQRFQFDKSIPAGDVKRRAIELLNESGALASYAQAPRNLEEIANVAELACNGYIIEDERPIKEASQEDPIRVELFISNEKDAPKLTKEGYWTYPSIEELRRMDERSLKYVENFTVGNEYGKIEFLGETDVKGVNLDELVVIQHGFAEVYPEARFPTEASKPRRGEKLNKPAVITLFNCFRKASKSKKRAQDLSTNQVDVEFLGYDEERGIYQMRVQHFTRYGFNDSEDEEEEIKQDFQSSRLPAPQFGAFVRGAEVQQPQRRGIGFMEIDKDDDFSQGSESKNLRDFIGGERERPGRMIADDELFEQSEEDGDFRGRHIGFTGKHGQKALKGNHGRILMPPEPQEDEEVDEFEEELVKAPETETGDIIEEKIEEETDYTQSKQSDLLNLADSFVAPGKQRVDWSDYVNNMNPQTKTRCAEAVNKLNLLNRMTFEKIQGPIDTSKKPFYMNRSFRVGWTKDGLAMARSDGSVSVHKIVLHKDVGRQTPEDDSPFDYERYKRNLPYLARNLYEPLMKSLINHSANMGDLSQLSISSDRRGADASFLKFPDSNGVANALKEYVENIIDRRALREEGDDTRKVIFADLRMRDLETFSLFNTLFGNFELNLWEHALNFEEGTLSNEEKEDLARRMQRSGERERQNRFIRKHGLSKWLERKSGQFVEADLYAARQSGVSPVEEILFYLSGKQIRKATEICNAHGLHNLAVLLSTINTSTHSKEIIKQQIDEWKQCRVLDNITYQDVYEFLSGNHAVIQLQDWTRLFGLDLWYSAKPNQPFERIFDNFYTNKLKNAIKPAQSYFKNPLEENPPNLDLAFILVGLHANHKDFNTHQLLSPYTYTSDCLDVKFLWIIEEFLSNNGAPVIQSSNSMNIENSQKLSQEKIEFKYRILRGFCFQLELLGLWEYAIYIILLASPQVLSDANKARYIRNIVQRNYKTSEIFTDKKTQEIKKKAQKKEILIEQLGLKQNLLHESKAFKYLYSFRYTKAIKDFMKCGSWKRAYFTLCRKLAPIAICNSLASKASQERAKTSLNFLENQLTALENYRHTLDTWDKEGSVILRVLREVLSQDNRLAYGAQEGVGAREAGHLVQLVNSLNDLEAIQDNVLGRVMVDKFRRELSLALLNRLSQNQFVEQKEKILECLEQLNKNIKEDKTQIGLRFIERDLQI